MSTPAPPFFLTEPEKASALWQKLAKHLEGRLEILRARNDDPRLDQMQTAAIRGHIEYLKSMLSIGNLPPITDGK